MEVKEYINPLLKWWWLIIACTLLSAISGYLAVSQQPATYRSSTTLMIGSAVDDPNPSAGELGLSQLLASAYGDIAQRRPVREQTMMALNLPSLPEYSARALQNSNLLEIAVVDVSPHRAQAVANELANQLIQQSPTAPRPEDEERRVFIEDQLSSLQTNIQETEVEIIAKQSELEAAFSAREIADLQNEIAALLDKLRTLQSNYGALLPNTQGGATNTLAVIEPAGLPRNPVGPNVPVTVATTAAVGFALAAAAAYFLEFLDDTIKTPKDVKRATGLITLPSIPRYDTNGIPRNLVARNEPRSPAVDAYRRLRTGILSQDEANQFNTILITSATPGEGKSSVAANLAVVLAQSGEETLLLDADLRRPSQQDIFRLREKRGFSDLLVGYYKHADHVENTEALLDTVIQLTDVGLLSVMASGPVLSDAFELLDSEVMEQVLLDLSERFDRIIIDSPPVLVASDSISLATKVGAVMIIADSRRIRRKQLVESVEQLQSVNANLIGVALNRVNAKSAGYYYQYYYYDKQDSSDKPGDPGQEERGSERRLARWLPGRNKGVSPQQN
jgi:non-specific protein-tyrosine kinase